MPEQRRLGYRPPRDPSEFVVLSEDGTPIRPKGVMSWFQAKMEEAQAQQANRNVAVTVDEDIEETPSTPARVTTTTKKVTKKQQHERNIQTQTGEDLEFDAEPVTSNGHSAKGAPKRTRSTRKTSQPRS